MTSIDAQVLEPANAPTRPFYWSLRRELWESRSVWIAPLAVAALVLFSMLIGTARLPNKVRNPDRVIRHFSIVKPYAMAPAPIIVTTFLVGLFYCLDALYGERRERSILFWKSLPVSDRTTVLAKAAIPLVVLPSIAIALSFAVQLILFLVSNVVLIASGLGAGALWRELPLFEMPLVLLYGVTAHVLWFAPIYGWLLLVSAWARRAPVLWAVLPGVALGTVERMVFNTTYLDSMMKYRVVGAMTEAFAVDGSRSGPIVRFSQTDPVQFLSTPGLWIGLIFAGAFLGAAMRLRRNREPI